MDVLVTYDIKTTTPEGERRLARVAHVCERYGVRAQYSVFECRVSESALARLIGALEDEIIPALDSVHLYRFAGSLAEARLSLGRRPSHDPGRPWIL